ncbi:MAG: SGNH/GDSL hydrolase family protein, partial [Bryobacteraceae bacterium]
PLQLTVTFPFTDSLSAGFQNGGLLDIQQVNGYASLVANQAHVPLPLPLILAPGIPNVLTLVSPGPPPVIAPLPGTSGGRRNPMEQAMDLAVPGANVQDALTTRPPFTFNNITDFVLGQPGVYSGISRSQVEWAEALAPTTLFVWLGNNDALGVVFTGDVSALTPLAAFEQSYKSVIARLAATGATMVLANIPDVTVVPYLTSAEEVAAQTGLPLAVIGPILGIGRGDYVTPDAFPLIVARLGNPALGKLPGNVVLDKAEVGIVRDRIEDYNLVIAKQARKNNAALVDIHELLNRIQAKGYVIGNQTLTTDFLGGIFSLDGIHPTNTGYGIVGNAFIKELNREFQAGILDIPLGQILSGDPLVLQGVQRRPSHEERVSRETVRKLRGVMAH